MLNNQPDKYACQNQLTDQPNMKQKSIPRKVEPIQHDRPIDKCMSCNRRLWGVQLYWKFKECGICYLKTKNISKFEFEASVYLLLMKNDISE
jgi:hypothetical protein